MGEHPNSDAPMAIQVLGVIQVAKVSLDVADRLDLRALNQLDLKRQLSFTSEIIFHHDEVTRIHVAEFQSP
jgi:hypothetical protein